LDVGCGSGKFLLELRLLGLSNLTGVDPFIRHTIVYANGVKVLKEELQDVDGQFDFIMLNHSFEHMPDPPAALRTLYRLLKPGRYLLIRIPLADSLPRQQYGMNWAGLDAPRHLYLHTRRSMEILCGGSGFEIAEIVLDSDGFTLWASEQYLRGIPLMDPRSYWVDQDNAVLTREEVRGYLAQGERLNRTGEADCGAFLLYRSSP
jgi:SAM-dependent methyltransferase